MLSNDAVKLLKWLEQHDKWMTPDEIKSKCKTFNPRDLKALKTQEMVDTQLNMDGGGWHQHRISDLGKAYLEGARYARMTNIREWMSFWLSVAAIAISIIALLMQEGIL